MNNNNGTNQLSLELQDFDFNLGFARTRSAREQNFDLLIGYRTAGNKRRALGCDINIAPFIQRVSKQYTKMAVGISRLKKHSTVLVVFDNDQIPDYGKVNHNQIGATKTAVVNNKGMTIKLLEAFDCEIPDKADCETRVYCKMEQAGDAMYKVQPLYVEYTDATNNVVRRDFDAGGLLPRLRSNSPSAKNF